MNTTKLTWGVLLLAACAPLAAKEPETLLEAALRAADKRGVPAMTAENDDLTAKSAQLAALAELYTRAGQTRKALAMIDEVEPARTRGEALGAVGVGLIERGEGAAARKIEERLASSSEWTSAPALAAMGRAALAKGDLDTARRLVVGIGDAKERAEMSLAIVRALPPATSKQDMQALLELALAAAGEVSPEGPHRLDWSPGLSTLLAVFEAAYVRGATAVADQAFAQLGEAEEPYASEWRARGHLARARLAARLATPAPLPAVLADLERAGELAMAITSPLSRAEIWGDPSLDPTPNVVVPAQVMARFDVVVEIAEAQHRVGRGEAAREAFAQAERLTDFFAANQAWDDLAERRVRLMGLATMLGDAAAAARMLELALAAAEPEAGFTSSFGEHSAALDRVRALGWAAAALALAGDARAEAWRGKSLAAVASVGDANYRRSAWEALSEPELALRGLDAATAVILRQNPAPVGDDRFWAAYQLADLHLASTKPEAALPLIGVLSSSAGYGSELRAKVALLLLERGEEDAARRLAHVVAAEFAGCSERERWRDLLEVGRRWAGTELERTPLPPAGQH